MPRRTIGILLLLMFLGLGSGLLEYLHNLDHAREDAELLASASTRHPALPQHDESNCAIHRQLHLPAICAPLIPLLVCLGLFVAFLTQLASQPVAHRLLTRLDCRGPPARLLSVSM